MNLKLSLKTKWFEMTKAGVKTEDYREINDYWVSRLCIKHPMSVIAGGNLMHKHTGRQFTFKKFDFNIMTLGYPKSTDTSRILKYKHAGIEIREGNPEWGSVPGKKYFVIKHGELIKT